MSARQSAPRGALRAGLTLLFAVVAFYVGKKIYYGIRYPGSAYRVNADDLVLYGVLALLAGVALGILGAELGRTGWRSAAATAAIVGLLLGEAYRRQTDYGSTGSIDVAVLFGVLAVLVVVAMGPRSLGQTARVVVLAVPLAVLGLAVVSGPDWIEQILIGGF